MSQLKRDAAKFIMRAAPIPGRYLDRMLDTFGLSDLDRPEICVDRWKDFKINIDAFDSAIKKQIYFQGYFEWAETRFLRRSLKPGDVFVDVGANIGWHSLVAASRVGAAGRVHAFEPVSSTFDELASNIALNHFDQVVMHKFGLSDCDGVVDIFGNKDSDSGGNSLIHGEGYSILEKIRIRRGEDVLTELGVDRIDLLKVDVEGAEIMVLRGLQRFFDEGRIRAMLLEINPIHLHAAKSSPQEIFDFVVAQGFSVADVRTPDKSMSKLHDYGRLMNICCQHKALIKN